jgi:hypothetical protein
VPPYDHNMDHILHQNLTKLHWSLIHAWVSYSVDLELKLWRRSL